MIIDWFVIAAQAFNFLLLIWLMKRFLYKPILKAIDAREKLIAEKLADADRKEAAAQAEQKEFQQKNEEFEQRHAELLSQATSEAESQRRRLLNEASEEADNLRAKRQEMLIHDAQKLDRAIGLRTQEEVFAIARKALADLSSDSLEERICEVFTRRLRDMGSEEKERLIKALSAQSGTAQLNSAFELSQAQRNSMQKTLGELFPTEIRLKFKTVPELIGGIELVANGHKIAWNIADYIASLEEGVDRLIKEGRSNEP